MPHQHKLPVWTAWGLGINEPTSIIFLQFEPGGAVLMIDYLEERGQTLDYFIGRVKDRYPDYPGHFFPHDVAEREMIAGSRLDHLQKRLGRVVQVPRGSIDTGITWARGLLTRCYFDIDKTARLQDCLAAYRSEYREDREVMAPKPVHDWSSHAADAFRCLAVAEQEKLVWARPSKRAFREPVAVQILHSALSEWGLDQPEWPANNAP